MRTFQYSGIYQCDKCDKVYEKAQSYNAHRKHCGKKNPAFIKKAYMKGTKIAGLKSKERRKKRIKLWLEGKINPKLNTTISYAKISFNSCEKCDINKWHGKRIVIEVHHKDGNRNNNFIENIEMFCPNCHSQTDNWKNKMPA